MGGAGRRAWSASPSTIATRYWRTPSNSGYAYPLLIGEQDALDAAAAFGVESPAFPFTVFTDRRGEVVALYIGELHKPQADLILVVGAKPESGPGGAAGSPANHRGGPAGAAGAELRLGALPATFAAEACHFTSISGYYRGPFQRDDAGPDVEMAANFAAQWSQPEPARARASRRFTAPPRCADIEAKLAALARAKGHELAAFPKQRRA